MTFSERQRDIVKNFIMGSFGMLLFAIGLNVFITPLNFFSGGIMGIAQLLRDFALSIGIPDFGIDLAGVMYWLINVPLLVLAYVSLGRTFFIRTIIMTSILSLFIALVPIPKEPLLHDPLTASVIGGIIAGIGCGLTLSSSYSAGGIDILGLYAIKKKPGFSVGRMGLLVNLFVFAYLFATQNFEVVVYSFLFTAVISVATDRAHIQNINVWVVVITKSPDVDKAIMRTLNRGVTSWDGTGAYTGEDTFIHTSMINKFEVQILKRVVLGLDPKAFVIFTEGSRVAGNFLKKL